MHLSQRACCLLAICCFIHTSATNLKAAAHSADVCIYGGTSGGVVAAVQVAAMGKTAIIVEPTESLGGMSSGGLGWTDFGRKDAVGGLARQFYIEVGRRYGKEIEFTLEPHVAEQVFEDWVRQDRIRVFRRQQLRHVRCNDSHIQELATLSGDVFQAKIFIDATYEGDLLAKAGVSYTVGRESNAQYGETVNGIQGPARSSRAGKFMTQPDPFIVPGDPGSGLLPMIHGDSRGKIGDADKRVQAYNYRLCLTNDPSNRRPIDPSPGYDPGDFELLARWIEARVAADEELALSDFLKYDPLPNQKFDFNNRWPISTDFMGGSEQYPEAAPAKRAEITKAHEAYLRDFLHFLATDERVPQAVRDEMSSFGLAKDEFVHNDNWPHQLYVREARRMVSDFVMVEQHCTGGKIAPKSIGLGCYNIDIHGVRRIFVDEKLENEGSNGLAVPQPYPISYDAIVPREPECKNLFVPFCLSASHVAFGSIRMEPVFMSLSQAAGTAACLAIDADVPVQQVDYQKLKDRLIRDGAMLEWEPAAPRK